MSYDCNEKNPLIHSGTTQVGRVLKALLPDSAKVDERSDVDLILFAKNYSKYLNYFDFNNNAEGNWEEFYAYDVCIVLAQIAKLNPLTNFNYISNLYSEINASSVAEKTKYAYIFDFVFTLAKLVHETYKNLPDDVSIKSEIKQQIQSQFSKYYQHILAYYNDSVTKNLIPNSYTQDTDTPFNTEAAAAIIDFLSSENIWVYNGIYNTETYINGSSIESKIKNTVSHNLFKGIIDAFLKNVARLMNNCNNSISDLQENYPKHSPHYALFLTFIKLFKYAQNAINTYTDRHLKHYYQTVLQLQNKNAEPDNVHIYIDLVKNISSAEIAADTAFKAGKDENGNELYYTNNETVIVNNASIAAVKNVFVQQDSSSEFGSYQKISCASNAITEDGLEKDFTSEDKTWYAFGNNFNNNSAIGFAISSPLLFSSEGTRQVKIYCYVSNAVTVDLTNIHTYFEYSYTGKKQWETPDNQIIAIEYNNTDLRLEFTISIGSEAPTICPYSQNVHGDLWNTSDPIIALKLRDTINSNPAEFFSDIYFTKIDLFVDVSFKNSFSIKNDVADIDPTKSFLPFTAQPYEGASFTIGSNELAIKNKYANVNVGLNIEWDETTKIPTDITNYDLHCYDLQNGIYHYDANNKQKINNPKGNNSYPSGFILYENNSVEIAYNENLKYTTDKLNGYLKFTLVGGDFGNTTYLTNYIQYAAKGSWTIGSTSYITPPSLPYIPKIKSLSINYNTTWSENFISSTPIDETKKPLQFFHLFPCGNKEIFPVESTSGISGFSIFPNLDFEGEMYIGLENVSASQTQHILFQVSEGSADPFSEIPTLQWYYLDEENNWIEYENGEYIDDTNNLTQSGIIQFPIPSEIANTHTIMPYNYFWIKCKASTDETLGVCKLINIHAQAIKLSLTDIQNSGVAFSKNLAANTISKLLVPNTKIKKVNQPYNSFGGRIIETDEHFYIRVSERLRHKNRAINIWDYEHIVLEEFKQLYKVKCLNHYQADTVDMPMKPGHVTLVPILDISNLDVPNPLRPYTPINVLSDIELFVKKRISPHVNLHVVNPIFEEVQMEFKVDFFGNDDAYYYQKLLDEIEQYLTPWAYGNNSNLDFGGSIKKSVIINFIEEREYVNFITCVKMYKWKNGSKISGDVDEISGETPRSVLAAFAGTETEPKHIIEYINVNCDCETT